jgi:hypothetical protein
MNIISRTGFKETFLLIKSCHNYSVAMLLWLPPQIPHEICGIQKAEKLRGKQLAATR